MSQGSLLFLGTGSSAGIPVIGCSCKVCTSSNPKNRRCRTSALIRYKHKNYLIDAGPDIKYQSLHHHLRAVSGLVLTHTHFDHIGGLEELRIFNFIQEKPIPCLLLQESLNDVKKLFYYLFNEKVAGQNNTSQFTFTALSKQSDLIEFEGLPIRYFRYAQGDMKVLGVRFGDLAYLTDVKHYSDEIFEFLEGISTLVVSALRLTPSHLHLSIDEAVDFVKRTQATNSYFIHMAHEIEHEHVESLLPHGIHLAYDGLEIPFIIKDHND